LPSTTRLGARQAELLTLLRRGEATVTALAAQLDLTRNAVRSHLLALEKRGLVARKGLQPGTRRPHELYELTPRAAELLAQPSDAVLSAILTALKEAVSPKQLRELLESGGAALARRYAPGVRARQLSARVRKAVRLLESLGGAPEMERTQDGFYIRSQACPLAAVVAEHPEACQLVENLLGRVIGAPVREKCLRNGKSQCRFAVGANGR
jgi:predicted ArsR family transcriptional regulator